MRDAWGYGRTRSEVEADVLVAALHTLADRTAVLSTLRSTDLTSSWHRAVFRALATLDDQTVPAHVALARSLRVPTTDVENWIASASPNTPRTDLARLTGYPHA